MMYSIILNAGNLSSEHFLLWACLIEKGSEYLQLIEARVMLQQMPLCGSEIKSFKLQTLYTRVSSSYYQFMTINAYSVDFSTAVYPILTWFLNFSGNAENPI